MELQRQREENGPNKHHLGSFIFLGPGHMACGILVPQLGIEPRSSTVKAQSPNQDPRILNSQDHFSWAHQRMSQRNSWIATQQKPLKSPWGEDDLFSSTSFKYTGSIIQDYRQQRIEGTVEKPSRVWEASSNWGLLFTNIIVISMAILTITTTFLILIFLLIIYIAFWRILLFQPLLLFFNHSVTSDSFTTLWTVVYQAPLSMGILQARIPEWVAIPFSRGSSWSGIEPGSPARQADSLPSEPP